MKLFNGKINILNVEQISSNSWKLHITFFDGYMHYTMNDIQIGDYVFTNSIDNYDNEEIGFFVVSNIDDLTNDSIIVESNSGLTPSLGEGIICRNENVSFIPTSLDGLPQQLIDYARNIDLNLFAKSIIEKINAKSNETSWHYGSNMNYLSNVDVLLSNENNVYSISVPENGILKTISFELSDLGELENIDENTQAYSITIDFDVNQVFTPNKEFKFENNKLDILGIMPEVSLMSIEDNTFKTCDIVYPALINYHTLQFKFISTVKTDANTLIVKLTF